MKYMPEIGTETESQKTKNKNKKIIFPFSTFRLSAIAHPNVRNSHDHNVFKWQSGHPNPNRFNSKKFSKY
jgi:hypothetical protein